MSKRKKIKARKYFLKNPTKFTWRIHSNCRLFALLLLHPPTSSLDLPSIWHFLYHIPLTLKCA